MGPQTVGTLLSEDSAQWGTQSENLSQLWSSTVGVSHLEPYDTVTSHSGDITLSELSTVVIFQKSVKKYKGLGHFFGIKHVLFPISTRLKWNKENWVVGQ